MAFELSRVNAIGRYTGNIAEACPLKKKLDYCLAV